MTQVASHSELPTSSNSASHVKSNVHPLVYVVATIHTDAVFVTCVPLNTTKNV